MGGPSAGIMVLQCDASFSDFRCTFEIMSYIYWFGAELPFGAFKAAAATLRIAVLLNIACGAASNFLRP